jgi:SAM-dependent methyltransferase
MVEIEVEETTCDLCGSSDYRLLYRMPDLRLRRFAQEYSVIECSVCTHRYLSPIPALKEFSKLYPESYYIGRDQNDPRQEKRYRIQAEYLPSINKGRILDVGCAEGDWLKFIKKFGWECYGTDVHQPLQQIENVEIKTGYLPEQDYPENFFDVVTAWSVLEHVRSPSAYFAAIHKILKSSGLFIFMVPNGDSLWSRWAFHDDVPRHIHFFRVKSLGLFASSNNFEISRIEHTNRIYSKAATGRGLFKRRILRWLGASWDEVIEGSENQLFRYVGHLGTLLDRALIHPRMEEYFKLCGNMIVICKKK